MGCKVTPASIEADPLIRRLALPALEALGVHPATLQDIAEARAFAAGLIGPGVCDAPTLAAIHRHAGGAAVFIHREAGAITGVLGWIPLSAAGLAAVLAGRFEGARPDLGLVAAADELPAAAYGWGIAASTRVASRAIVGSTIALIEDVLPDVPWFTRPATADGLRVIVGRFGYAPAPAATGGLYWRLPRREQAA